MSYVIALAGKGGTGKTTIAALLVRLLKENRSGSVLAVDADPNSNLAEALGLEAKETIGTILDDIAGHPEKIPSGMPKDRFIEYQVQSAVAEGEGFDVLTMGRPEGPGCYCYVNNALRNVVGKLIKDYKYVVIDNEAGLEHLSRRTTRKADTLLIISDATIAGLRAAKRINVLAKELKIETGKNLLVINRAEAGAEPEGLKNSGMGYLGSLPEDCDIEKVSANGSSLMSLKPDALCLTALRQMGDKIWQ
jgi:CO dehydrogenase maturation factor